jgi:chromosome segregation ATPase
MEHVDEELRRQMIAEAAYFRAEHHGFDGDPVSDWLEAENEIDAMLGEGDAAAGSLKDRLAATNERLRILRTKLVELKAGAREEYEADLERVTRLRDRLRKWAKEAGDQSGHAAEKAKARAEEAWHEISARMEALSHRQGKSS